MNLLSNIFKSNKVDCPRCLGSGHVDLDDIKRLNKELKWKPGKCAYCNGKGVVNFKVLKKVSFDYTYLSINLPNNEINRIFNNDKAAINRGIEYENNIETLIEQVIFLSKSGLNKNEIFEFYKIQLLKSKINKKEINEFSKYIETIINTIKK